MSREWDDEERRDDREEDEPDEPYRRCYAYRPRNAREAAEIARMREEAWMLGELADACATDGLRRGLDRGRIVEAVAEIYGQARDARALGEAAVDVAASRLRGEFEARSPDVDFSPIRPRRPLDPEPRPTPDPGDYDPEEE